VPGGGLSSATVWAAGCYRALFPHRPNCLQEPPEEARGHTASGETGFVSRTLVTQDNQELLIHEQSFQKILGLGGMGNTRVGPR